MGNLAILEKSVVQVNPLIHARKQMNITELRIFLLGLQDIVPHIKDDHFHDVDFRETVISNRQLRELFGADNDGSIANLKKQTRKASQSIIEMDFDDGGFEIDPIYRKVRYVPQKGLVIHFNDEMKPYILEILNQPYTRCKVKAFFTLSSVYAWRILESLLEKQGYLGRGHNEVFVELTMEELRFRLNIPDGAYKGKINNFRSRILDLPIKEINEKTDYFVWYEVQKTGRKVTGFKLWLKLKDGVKLEDAIGGKFLALPAPKPKGEPAVDVLAPMPKNSFEELTMAMEAEGLKKAAINTWLKRDGYEYVKSSFELAVQHANSKLETKYKGEQRTSYIKSCMESNIAAINEQEAKIKEEIEEREKRLEEEKIAKTEAMTKTFKSMGILSAKPQMRGGDPQSAGEILNTANSNEPQFKEMTDTALNFFIDLWTENRGKVSDAVLREMKKYGLDSNSFALKYWREIYKKSGFLI